MEFNWNSDTIRRYRAANEYTGFYKKIAALIAPKIQGYSTFCDIGCGLGLVDLELSPSIERITCVDINAEAIAALRESIKEQEITNIAPCLMDYRDIRTSWDVIYLSFFGSRQLIEFLPRCKKLFAVVNGTNSEHFYLKKYRKFAKRTVTDVRSDLESHKIPYDLTELSLEFGQPLQSLADALDFLKSYSPLISQEEMTDIFSRLILTQDERYPLFLPHEKTIGLFEITGTMGKQVV